MLKYVDVEALNVRSEPILSPDNRLAVLPLGHRVKELGAATEFGWLRIQTEVNGRGLEGVVKGMIEGNASTGFQVQPSLRPAVSEAREALVSAAIKEWLRFEQGQGKEHQDPFFRFVGEMWRAIGLNLDGRDRDTPWSAAAISFTVRNASKAFAKYGTFRFAPAHAKYMHDSIQRRKAGDNAAPFWGFRLHEEKPQIGDIVGRWRETPRDFEDAENSDAFKSHSDVIVSVSPDFVLAIGGNVNQSVSITRYPKTSAGFLSTDHEAFMLMVNRV